MDKNKAGLRQILLEKSVRTGNFVLSSGKSSTFYVDARLTTMSPDGMTLIGQLGLNTIRDHAWDAESIGGLTLGADPVSFAISYTSAATEKPLRAFTVRKEAKQHGTGNLIEGPFKSGDKVVVIEDVITTGKSALQAIDSIISMNGQILGVLSVVDREDGGREAIEARGYPVAALFKISELLS
jgi:orotate phosphoribosyltransferase